MAVEVTTMEHRKIPQVEWGTAEITGPRHDYRESLLLGLIKRNIPGKARVLDAGCGGGSLLFKMASLGYHVRGVEASPLFIEKIRSKLRKRSGGEPGVEILPGSVTELPLPDAGFDALVSGEVLEHVKEDEKAVREFNRVLKDNGVCIISVPAHPDLWDDTDEWAGHVRRYERESLIRLFEENGFHVEQVLSWGFPFVRCYSRFVYLPYFRRKMLHSKGGDESARVPEGERYRSLSAFLGYLFHLDSLFSRLPYGIGWLLVARKRDGDKEERGS